MNKIVQGVAGFVIFMIALGGQSYAATVEAQRGYDWRTTVVLQDEFCIGSGGSGSVGALGWNAAGTVSAGTGSLANHPCTIIVDTGASSGTIARIGCFGSGAGFNSSYPQSVTWDLKATQIDGNTTIRFGTAATFGTNPPNDGVYFERLDADTNWFVVTRASSTSVRVDTGIAADTNFHRFRFEEGATAVRFYIDDVLIGTQTANISSAYVCPGAFIINSTAASKKIEIDYFEMRATNIGR